MKRKQVPAALDEDVFNPIPYDAQVAPVNKTTLKSMTLLDKLEKLSIVAQKNKGKISAFIPKHPSILEAIAEKRLRIATRQIRNLESNLPSLINYYNEHQNTPGAITFYGQEGVKTIWNKVIAAKQPYYFVRSQYDEVNDEQALEEFKQARIDAGIIAENITPSEYTDYDDEKAAEWLLTRTFLPPNEYSSPIEIDIFGDNVAFINYSKDGMSTLIESPEIADAMRQVFLFAKKYIRKATKTDKTTPPKAD